MGTPCAAKAMWMSSTGPSTWRGEAAVTTVEMRGRSRNRSRSPDRRLADAQHRVHFLGAVDERHVLRRLGDHGEVLDELAALERDVGRADLRPHEVHLGELVHEGGALAQVLEGAWPPQARAEVEGLGHAPAGGEVERLVRPEDDVVLRSGAGHHEGTRNLGDRPLDEVAGQAGDACGFVDLGASRGEQRQHLGTREAHADGLQHLEGLIRDAALLGLGEPCRLRLHVRPHLRGPKPSALPQSRSGPDGRRRRPSRGTLSPACRCVKTPACVSDD